MASDTAGKGVAAMNLRKDAWSIATLLLLYVLQGIPMGLAEAVPLILTANKGMTMERQAVLQSMVWPYSLKVLWAPVVDTYHLPGVGRRKSWVVPLQLAVGVVMIIMSFYVHDWVYGPDPAILTLTSAFFLLYLLVATQDIAVDGWALTMLSPENVGFAASCNAVGQMTGYMGAYAVFMGLDSPTMSDHIRSALGWSATGEPLVTLAGFMAFWGWVFIGTTLCLAAFKRERLPRDRYAAASAAASAVQPLETSVAHEEAPQSLREAYMEVWRVVNLPNVRSLAFILVTGKIAFAATDAATKFELAEGGVPRVSLAILGVAYAPIEIAFSAYAGKRAAANPLASWLAAYPLRATFAVLMCLVLATAPWPDDDGNLPTSFYVMAVAALVLYRLAANVMFVSQMAFFSRVADPTVGGTYMTILNTVANIGTFGTAQLVLFCIGWTNVTQCYDSRNGAITLPYACDVAVVANATTTPASAQPILATPCHINHGVCLNRVDGYEVMVAVCIVLGLAWLWRMKPELERLQRTRLSSWHVPLPHRRAPV